MKYFNSWARPPGSLREWISGRGGGGGRHHTSPLVWWATCRLLYDLFNKLLISGERSSGEQWITPGSCGEGHFCGNGEARKCNIRSSTAVVPTLSAPGDSFVKDDFSHGWQGVQLGGSDGGWVRWGGGIRFRNNSKALYLLYFCYYYISISDYHTLDPGGWGPLLYRTTTNIALPIPQTFFCAFLHISAKVAPRRPILLLTLILNFKAVFCWSKDLLKA